MRSVGPAPLTSRRVSGIRGVLAIPRAYEAWSRLVGAEYGRATLVREYVRPRSGARVLDLGCGPGDLVRHLGDVSYVGVDVSEAYVAQARKAYSGRAEFRVGDATRLDADLRDFDLVLAFGVLHHLDDDAAAALLRAAHEALGGEGRIVTVDPALTPGERLLARVVIAADRGRHVRTADAYGRLVEPVFGDVRSVVRRDLLRIPYTHCVVEAKHS